MADAAIAQPGTSSPAPMDVSSALKSATAPKQYFPPPPKVEAKPDVTAKSADTGSGQGADQLLKAAQAAMEKFQEAEPKPPQTSPEQTWGGAAMAVAALGGLLTHTPAAVAMNAMAGVLNATKQGDAEKAKQEFDRWKVAHEAAGKMVDYTLKLYDEALKTQGPQAKLAAIRAVDAQLKLDTDQAFLQAAGGDPIRAAQMRHAALSKAAGSTSAAADKIMDQRSAIEYWDATHTDANPEQRGLAHMAIRAGKDPDARKGAAANWQLGVDPKTGTPFSYRVGDQGQIEYGDHAEHEGIAKPTTAAKSPASGDVPEYERIHAEKVAIGQLAEGKIADQEKELGRKLTQTEKAKIYLAVQTEHEAEKAGLKTTATGTAKAALPGPKSALTGAALDRDAEYYHTTHQLPPGFGGQADRDAIKNREVELYPTGSGGNAAVQASSFKADTSSLANMTKIRDAAKSYEAGAIKELDLAASLAPNTPQPLDIALLTRWARTGETQFGNVEVPEYLAALISGLDEYAKVLSGGTGAAPSSDASRAQALSLIPPGATTAQVKGIVKILKMGMEFKINGYDNGIDEIKSRMGGSGGGSPGASDVLKPKSSSNLSKPAGMSDAEIVAKAKNAIASGKPKQAILDQLHAWGVNAEGL